jgi:hypothetical protein
MRRHPSVPRVVSLAALVVVAIGVAYWGHRSRGQAASLQPSPLRATASPLAAAPAAGKDAVALTTLFQLVRTAQGQQQRDRGGQAGEQAADQKRAVREEAARQERAIMARVWGFSAEQSEKFEAAATAPRAERASVYQELIAGQLTQAEFYKALEAADERDSAQLRTVLGSHYQEYSLMRGHFTAANLEHEPFVPPTIEHTTNDYSPRP